MNKQFFGVDIYIYVTRCIYREKLSDSYIDLHINKFIDIDIGSYIDLYICYYIYTGWAERLKTGT